MSFGVGLHDSANMLEAGEVRMFAKRLASSTRMSLLLVYMVLRMCWKQVKWGCGRPRSRTMKSATNLLLLREEAQEGSKQLTWNRENEKGLRMII